jgi:hypothetical protein
MTEKEEKTCVNCNKEGKTAIGCCQEKWGVEKPSSC